MKGVLIKLTPQAFDSATKDSLSKWLWVICLLVYPDTKCVPEEYLVDYEYLTPGMEEWCII